MTPQWFITKSLYSQLVNPLLRSYHHGRDSKPRGLRDPKEVLPYGIGIASSRSRHAQRVQSAKVREGQCRP